MIKTLRHYTSRIQMRIIRIISMSQKISVNGFEWVKYLSQVKEGFTKHYDENSDKQVLSIQKM